MNYWLVKREPEKYSFDDFVRDGKSDWNEVRNFQARNNLRQMRLGDRVLFYHSRSEKAVAFDRIKADAELQNIGLIKQSRLSVMPLTGEEFELIVNNSAPSA